MSKTKTTGIVSLSGGLDSSTLLATYKDEIGLCVFFNYGSKQNKRELKAATQIANHYKKDLLIIDARGLFASFDSALLSHSSKNVELGAYGNKTESNAKVPFRNIIFASTLVGIAESRGFTKIFLAPHAGDHAIYADCRHSVFIHLNDLVGSYCYHSSIPTIEIETPFIFDSKEDIAKKALALGVPIDLTYSCYLGGEEHCGKCPTCIERINSLGLFQGGF